MTTVQSLSCRTDEQGQFESHIYLPLYPLAEWLADNWWFLQSETERPDTVTSRDFDCRHNLRWAREGFVLPSLHFVTLGDDVDVHWEPLDIPGTGIKFLAGGHAVLPNSVFAQTLRDFVSAVVGRLDDMGIPGTTLHEQWLAIQQTNADSQEQEFCDAAARLGVDPYAIDSGLGAVIVNVSETIASRTPQRFSFAGID